MPKPSPPPESASVREAVDVVTVTPDDVVIVTLKPQIQNATAWQYPLDFHTALCNRLGVNPRIWILPDGFQGLVTTYTDERDDMVDAYADELNNVVFFWTDDWTDEYRLWVIAHELWHVSQFFDNGNKRSSRWRGMSAKERDRMWEREAVQFANKMVEQTIHRDFSAYKSHSTITAARRRKHVHGEGSAGKSRTPHEGNSHQGSDHGSGEGQQT